MRTLAALAPWTAKPLSAAAKNAKFREVMSHHADRALMGRQAVVAGWVVGAAGFACFAASIYGWVAFLPLKTVENHYYGVDKSTGIIAQPTALRDVPMLFGEATDHHYLKIFLRAREGWVPELDRENDHLVKIMSRADEQERYGAWRKLPTSPLKAIGRNGHISLDNFRFHPSAETIKEIEAGTKEGTRKYMVQFEHAVWKGDALEFMQTWTAEVDFQWHPELPMSPADRDSNPGGMQAISVSADPDTPAQGRQS